MGDSFLCHMSRRHIALFVRGGSLGEVLTYLLTLYP